ncbi:MAG: helix-turn-helix transcriptional regulator, partial [Deltaproteobacteria bacterium]|nr:helix-turn-helix transcriptional regulator [Deltaproteobacteria bacterium]
MITRGLERSLTTKGRLARQRILAAAEKLLATRGFHGTSLRDVAREAKIPLATAVYHFARKEQLYSAVLQSIGAQLVAALDEVAKVRGPEGRLELFARALINWTADEPERVRLLLRELLDNPGRVDQAS